MPKCYIGIDNGVTGTIAIFHRDGKMEYCKVPIKKQTSYPRAKKRSISRLHWEGFHELLKKTLSKNDKNNMLAILENPFKNPVGLEASISAARCFEAQTIFLEMEKIPHINITPREWQKEFLPKNLKKSAELKEASRDLGIQRWPSLEEEIQDHGDADGLFIAEYARLNNW